MTSDLDALYRVLDQPPPRIVVEPPPLDAMRGVHVLDPRPATGERARFVRADDPFFAVPAEVRDAYHELRVLPDGQVCGVHRLMFHWTLHVDIDPLGAGCARYCYHALQGALHALRELDGVHEPLGGGPDHPLGWHRAPYDGRRRDLATGREEIRW